ncbi:MAG: TRAP transporter permease [Truepera sp.]|jgi:TRAP transporter 4TM/12TM fusion protein|nr:TRAP transporter permease [Truepera sp.]
MEPEALVGAPVAKAPPTRTQQVVDILYVVVAITLGLFHLYTAGFGLLTAFWQRGIHLVLGALLVYLTAFRNGSKATRVIAVLMSVLGVAALLYFFTQLQAMAFRFGMPNQWDLVVGVVFIVLTLDFGRRVAGNILPGIALLAILYAYFGHYLPTSVGIRAYSLERIVSQMSLSTEGIFGIPLGVSATYIFLFVLFGAFLQVTGVGQFYMDLATRLVGWAVGGPAKIAVLSSSLLATISGSAVANVAGTGSITIPMMVRKGFSRPFAAAVEAVASTGGQIMPPVMGAGAFIMAEILGIPYSKVILAALVPALIYYGSVFSVVHFTSHRIGLKPETVPIDDREPLAFYLLKNSLYFVPLVVLVVLLTFVQTSITRAAVFSVLAAVVVGLISPKDRLTPSKIVTAFVDGARTALVVIASTALAGVVVGIINLTGIGLRFSSAVIALGSDQLLLTLILMMIASILIGMGLPTTPAYLIMAVLGAPALVKLGIAPIAAHMFVFYFGCLSMITPPVALANFAAASIVNANFWRTSGYAMMLGLPGFLVPYMFVYDPSLVGLGTLWQIVTVGTTGLLGAVSVGAGLSGWLLTRTNIFERVLLAVGGFALIHPGHLTNLAGFGLLGLVVALQLLKMRRIRSQQTGTEVESIR